MSARARSAKTVSGSGADSDFAAAGTVPPSHLCSRNFAPARRSYALLASSSLSNVGTGNLQRQFEQAQPFAPSSAQIKKRTISAPPTYYRDTHRHDTGD